MFRLGTVPVVRQLMDLPLSKLAILKYYTYMKRGHISSPPTYSTYSLGQSQNKKKTIKQNRNKVTSHTIRYRTRVNKPARRGAAADGIRRVGVAFFISILPHHTHTHIFIGTNVRFIYCVSVMLPAGCDCVALTWWRRRRA